MYVPADASVLINGDVAAEELVSSLQVLEVASPALHSDILPEVNICLIQNCSMDFWQYLQTTCLIVYNKFVFKHLPYVPECRAALI
jgi:hypothetical protein